MCAMAQPQWTRREESRGLDPLGMQSTCISLYQQLVPGISNVTLRMRYYGLYAWLSDWYSKTDRRTSVEGWRQHIRRSEALYALMVRATSSEGGVAGTRWAGRRLDQGAGAWVPFAAAADGQTGDGPSVPQYLKQRLGAYGAAYGTQLLETGVLCGAENHDVPVRSDGIGTRLAAGFALGIGSAADLFQAAVRRGSVRRSELQKLAAMGPAAIGKAGQERNEYEKLLFARSGRKTRRDEKRRLTLQLILRVAEWLGRTPSVEDLRWALYAPLGAANGLLLADQDEAGHCYTWTVYLANDLCHACYEALLKYSLDVLAGYPGGVALDTWLAEVMGRVMGALGEELKTWDGLVGEVSLPESPWTDVDDSEFTLIGRLLSTSSQASATEAEGAVTALRLLAVLYKRFLPQIDELERELKPVSGSPFVQSLATEIRLLNQRASELLETTLRFLVRTRVIDRHLWVAMQKLRIQRDYTFLFEIDNGCVRLRGKDGPVLTNPRLGTSINFLRDIHLLGANGLTRHGKRVLGIA